MGNRYLLKFGIVIFLIVINSIALISQSFKTVGYLPTYRFDLIEQMELDSLTHLNIAFANPDANGMLTTEGIDIQPVVGIAQDVGLDVFIALAGGGAKLSDWEDWISPANRSLLIHNIMNYVSQHNLQGIDVDLEWGNVNDDYSGFVLELKDSVDQHGLKLSVALPGAVRYSQITDEALNSFDWINIMAYDLTGPWRPNDPGPHSPYSYARNSIDFWDGQGVNKSKLVLGVPFYGYDFTDQNNVLSVKYSEMIGLDPTYSQLDQVGQIYYNGLPTIEQKTKMAINELGGIMIWELGQDSFDEYSLLKKISETIDTYHPSSVQATDQSVVAELYPNPASDLVHLKLNKPQNIKIALLSHCQNVMKVQEFYNQDIISIGVDEFPEGLYFLLLEGRGFRKAFKLVIL